MRRNKDNRRKKKMTRNNQMKIRITNYESLPATIFTNEMNFHIHFVNNFFIFNVFLLFFLFRFVPHAHLVVFKSSSFHEIANRLCLLCTLSIAWKMLCMIYRKKNELTADTGNTKKEKKKRSTSRWEQRKWRKKTQGFFFPFISCSFANGAQLF